MTTKGKNIQPECTAAEKLAQQQQTQQNQPVADNERFSRKNFDQLSAEQQAQIVALQNAPLLQAPSTVSNADIVPRFNPTQKPESVRFQLRDGRVIEMAPPSVPHMLVLPNMFVGMAVNSVNAVEASMRERNATVMLYVRSIDGTPLPDPLTEWHQVVSWMHRLGDLGCRAIFENYDLHWPDRGAQLWKPLKSDGE